jgi:hypothetical protein
MYYIHLSPPGPHRPRAHTGESSIFSAKVLILYMATPSCLASHSWRCKLKLSASGAGIRGKMPIFRITLPGYNGVSDLMGLEIRRGPAG